MFTRRPESPAGEVRFEIQTPPTTDPISLAISPDGQKIVFVATSEGGANSGCARLDSTSAEPLAGTDGAMAPFWSPDSRSVAFFTSTDNRLKRLDIDGRSMQVLGTFPLGTGGTWNRGRHDSLFDARRAVADLPNLLGWWRSLSGHAPEPPELPPVTAVPS